MIEITCIETGDRAEAETPEAALLAARTLMEDAWNGNPTQGFKPSCKFERDGDPIPGMYGVRQPAVWAALGKARREREAV